MASYEALYRKWRPQTFEDIVAQPHITRTLKNQVLSGKTAHSYIFTGSRGTGKTTCARILAKAVNCLHPKDGDPCLECEICKDAQQGTLTDIIEIDGASNNGVDEVRTLRENAAFLPTRCKQKVYIIDEVHMMSPGAFNALLKIIEEPPPYVKFIFATTEIHKVPATILSRCQRFDFRRILPEDIAGRLRYIAQHETFTITDDAAMRIAMLADGGMRDALSLLDQCAACSDKIDTATVEEVVGVAGTESVYAVLEAIARRDAAEALRIVDELYTASKDMTRFCDELSQKLRAIMLSKAAPASQKLLNVSESELDTLRRVGDMFSMGGVLSALHAVRECCDRMTRASNRRMELEMTLISLTADTHGGSGDMAALSERVERLEQRVSGAWQGTAMPQNAPAVQPSPPANIPAQNLQVTGQTEQGKLEPVNEWQTILVRFHEREPSVTSLLHGSSAYLLREKHLLLLYVKNRLFKRLFTTQHAAALGACAAEVLGGEPYSIRFKCVDTEGEQSSDVDKLLQRAKDAGIPTEVSAENNL